MCENAYLSIKNPKASRALKQALDPGRRMLASLARLRFATSATFGLRSWGPPLDQILDPHLICTPLCDANGIYISFLDIFTHVLYQFATMLQNSLRGNSPSLNEKNHYKTILL